jgi:2-phosphoglycerate kinase
VIEVNKRLCSGKPGARAGNALKTIVVNEKDNTRVPFLRGILIRSLLDTGLEFKEAFDLASRVRDGLSNKAEIQSHELRQRVGAMLEQDGLEDVLELYHAPPIAPARIHVRGPGRAIGAFSRGKHGRDLQASGMKLDRAEQVTALIYDQLLASGIESISTLQLGYLTYLCLQQEVSKKAADRYLVWSEFQRSSRPLILMICGAVGTGKSTIATEVAHLLDVVRIQSTDMLREVMRMMIPRRLLPVLHTSSFNAWKELPIQDKSNRSLEQLIADGYRSQVELLAVACEAVLQRAVEESVPIILEGVHAHPDLLQLAPEQSQAIMAHVTLAVLRPKELKARLRGRGDQVPQRRAKRYLNKFEAIWTLQSFLLSEADRCDVPIITNQDKDRSVTQIVQYVNQELAKHFKRPAVEVFGEPDQDWEVPDATRSWREFATDLAG